MIYVGGVPFASDDSSQGMDILLALMEYPLLVSVSKSVKSTEEKKVSVSENSSSAMSRISKWVYIFQKEFATVNPALVDLVGTDKATTCVSIATRNRKSGMISFTHMDIPEVVGVGQNQMLSSVADHDSDALLDVHLIGGFDDTSSQHSYPAMYSQTISAEHSYPLCAKTIETPRNRNELFQIQTLDVLWHNTRWDSEGIPYPHFPWICDGDLHWINQPASFDQTSRGPDEIIRRNRVTASSEHPNRTGRLLDTYSTRTDTSLSLLHALGPYSLNTMHWHCKTYLIQRCYFHAHLHLMPRGLILWIMKEGRVIT